MVVMTVPTWLTQAEQLEADAHRKLRQAAEIRKRAELAGMVDEVRAAVAAARGKAETALADLDLAERNLGAMVLKVMPGAAERQDGEDGVWK